MEGKGSEKMGVPFGNVPVRGILVPRILVRRVPVRRVPVGRMAAGIVAAGGLPGCAMIRRSKMEGETFQQSVGDSVGEVEELAGLRKTSGKSARHEVVRWQEVRLSPPDSAGCQYVNRIRTASARALEETERVDTVSLHAFRQQAESWHSSVEGGRYEEIKPAARGGWIGGGLLLGVLLFYLSRWRKRDGRE